MTPSVGAEAGRTGALRQPVIPPTRERSEWLGPGVDRAGGIGSGSPKPHQGAGNGEDRTGANPSPSSRAYGAEPCGNVVESCAHLSILRIGSRAAPDAGKRQRCCVSSRQVLRRINAILKFPLIDGGSPPRLFMADIMNNGTGAASFSLFLRILPFHQKKLRRAFSTIPSLRGESAAAAVRSLRPAPCLRRPERHIKNPPDL